MPEPLGAHAVVIGAGFAGLLAAQVLSGRYETVTVLDRDHLSDEPVARPGVPQGHHPHALLARGITAAEDLLPGITEELVAHGGLEVEWPVDLLSHGPYGWEWRGDRGSGLLTVSASRPLVDRVIRRRVLASERIRVRPRHEVTGLLRHGPRITGVRARRRGAAESVKLPADLVIDAGGRRSAARRWLTELGCSVPEPTVVNPFQGYATAEFRRGPGALDEWKVLACAPHPAQPRGCVMVPVEGDRWIATITGFGRDYPPTDIEGYLEFAATLPGSVLHDVVRSAERLSPVRGFRNIPNHRIRYDRVTPTPEGFLVVGDAICAFNPVYAQGLSTAAVGAQVLRDALAEHARHGRAGSARRFHRALLDATAPAWQLATASDCQFDTTVGGRVGPADRLLAPVLDRVLRAAATDGELALKVNEVMHLMARPSSLLRPRTVLRALRPARSGSAAPTNTIPSSTTRRDAMPHPPTGTTRAGAEHR